jgi:hypothetical protein
MNLSGVAPLNRADLLPVCCLFRQVLAKSDKRYEREATDSVSEAGRDPLKSEAAHSRGLPFNPWFQRGRGYSN